MAGSLRLDQLASWQRGQPLSVESYVAKFPDLAADPEAIVDLIEGEIELRESRGEVPLLAEYLKRFPQCADRLIERFAHRVHAAATNVAPRAAEDNGGEEPPDEDTADKSRYATVVSQPRQHLAAAVASLHPHWPQIPGFEILGELGRGGMGIVYRARQISADRLVALKVVRSDVLDSLPESSRTSTLERFRHEAQAAAKLEHDNLVTVYEVGNVGDVYYYAMKFVEGQSLYEMVREEPLASRRAAKYVEPIARALHLAHEQGILHRDLKPHNILVDHRSDRPLLADFGLAKFVERRQDLTLAGEVMGTPSYMSPEQTRDAAKVTAAADVYSLGATLYHLITGRPPFLSSSLAETTRQVCEVEPVPPWVLNPAIDRDLETICLKCLQKEPARRYDTAQALADDLARYLDGRPIVARPVGIAERAWRWCRRNPRVAGLSAAVAALAAVALAAIIVGYVRTNAALALSQQRLKHAMQVVDDMFTRVSEDELLNEPGFQPLRRELLERALVHYDNFLKENAGNPQLQAEVADSQFRVALISAALGDRQEALRDFQAAQARQEELWKRAPDAPPRIRALATTLNALGNYYKEGSKLAESAQHYRRVVELRLRLCQLEPQSSDNQLLLANTRMNLAMVEARLGQTETARELLDEAQRVRLALLEKDPRSTRIRRDLARGYYNMARAELALEDLPAAQQHLHQAIDDFERVRKADPRSLADRYSLGVCCQLLGGLLADGDDLAAALAMYDKAREQLRFLAAGNPEVMHYQAELAALAMSQGLIYEDQQNWTAALAAWTTAHDDFLALLDREPKHPEYRRHLATSLSAMGNIALELGDAKQAQAHLTAARDRLQALVDELPGDELLARQLAETVEDLKACAAASGESR